MQRPKLEKMCETFIRIGLQSVSHEQIFDMIKFKVYPAIRKLKNDEIVDWYSFMIHSKDSGVPTTLEDGNLYFHVRVSLAGNNNLDNLKKSLPDYCLMTREAQLESVKRITLNKSGTIGFDPSLLKHESIEEVWRTIGEQSEFFLNVFDGYKENALIPIHEIWALLHYYHNMVGLSTKCPKCGIVLL